MESKYALSIIIPIYNSEKYICDCIESIVAQDFKNIEIICINDGSTDSTGEVLEQLKNKYDNIFVFKQENKGVSAARNLGLSKATGKYIFFLDSDDMLNGNWISDAITKCNEEELEILYFSYFNFYDSADVEKKYKRVVNKNIRNREYEERIVTGRELLSEFENKGDFRVSPCIQIVKRSFLEANDIQFYEGILYEDALYTITILLKAKRCLFINKAWYKRRIREGSIEHSPITADHLYGIFKGLILIEKIFENIDFDIDTAESVGNYLARRVNFLVKQYIKSPENVRMEFFDKFSADEFMIYKTFVIPCVNIYEKMKIQDKKIEKKNKDIEFLRDKSKRLKEKNDALRTSYAFRIGSFVIKPVRFIRNARNQ